jgi:hypothetical protein
VETDAGAAERGQRQALPQRIGRIAAWIAGVALLLAALELAGVSVLDWIDDPFDKVAQVPAWAIVAGATLESIQTTLAALAWYGITRSGSSWSSPPGTSSSRSSSSPGPSAGPAASS